MEVSWFEKNMKSRDFREVYYGVDIAEGYLSAKFRARGHRVLDLSSRSRTRKRRAELARRLSIP
jgi:hypothetical protein